MVVVEPDLAVAEVLAFILETEGAAVQIAHDLSTATHLLNQCQPDLLLCNLKLPDGEGYSLLHHCQQLKFSATQPILAIGMTDFSWRVERQKAISAGFHYYLFEPMERAALMEAIVQVWQKRDWQAQSPLSSGVSS